MLRRPILRSGPVPVVSGSFRVGPGGQPDLRGFGRTPTTFTCARLTSAEWSAQ
jgi:hypothetical protein